MKKMIVESAVLVAMVTLFFSTTLSAQQPQELKGPIKDDFAKIDTDEDGYITKEELEKAPKPKGRKRE